MNKKKKIYLFAFILIFLFGIISVKADTWPAPVPFEIRSYDGSRVFCFNPEAEESDERAVLYDNSEPPNVIYTVKGLRSWAYKSNFYFSNDFQNFVFFPPTGFDIAFEFYANGELQKTYYIKDLVKNIDKVPKSITTAGWRDFEESVIQNQNILTFKTFDGITYSFDIATGAIEAAIEGNAERTITFWEESGLILIVVFICIAGVILFLLIRNKRSGPSARKIPKESNDT